MRNSTTFNVGLLCVLVALLAGIFWGGHPSALPGPVRNLLVEDDQSLRAELIDKIDDNFYKPVDEKQLETESLKGMVRALKDRFSHYFTPEETNRFEESVSGRFDGVGMSVEQDKRGLVVLTVFEGSPAEKAGISKDDVITHVNGDSIAGEASDISTAKIKGDPGTKVRLTIDSPGSAPPRTLKVERASIDIPVARGRLREVDGQRLGWVQLFSFSSGAHGKLREQIDELLKKGARGLVLDLRGNGGGLLTEAVLVSSVFIEDGPIVSTDGRTKPRREFTAKGDAIDSKIPVVLLVDRGTASASEIVTGALRDRKRATVVGERTFGKGVFQEIEPLSNGGTLDITVGSYYLPNGENLANKGITPTVKARDLPKTKRDEALPIALKDLRAKLR
jgi:carboxyl-terminal processing protease